MSMLYDNANYCINLSYLMVQLGTLLVKCNHYVPLPLRSLAFHTPVIDRQDGFPEPVREVMP